MPRPASPCTLIALLSVLCTLALTGCSINSEITRSYVNPKVPKTLLQGALVVGVAQNPEVRKDFEDAFALALSRRGVRAEASYRRVPDVDAEGEEFIAAAKAAGLDTILVTRYVGERVDEIYHPGTVYYNYMPAYGGPYPGNFGNYYSHAYEVAYQQPAWSTNRTYTLISDLFATDTKTHVWQAISDTIRSGSDRKLRDDFIRSFVGDLKRQGLVK